MAEPTPANTKRSVAMNSDRYDFREVALNESPRLPIAIFTIFFRGQEGIQVRMKKSKYLFASFKSLKTCTPKQCN